MRTCLLLAVTLTGIAACAPPVPPAMAPGVVATYEGGVVTREDLDAAILAKPPAERRVPTEDAAGWYAEHIRELVLDRTALEEARGAGLERDPVFESRVLEATRSIVVAAYLQRKLPAIASPTEAELRAAFAADGELGERVERREVFHLFRRRHADKSSAEMEAEVATLRGQLLRGAPFEELAREHSESESRHRGGELGWMERGTFPPALDAIIFKLEKGVPSDPVVTREGVHLFLVRDLVEPKRFTFEEVRSVLAQQLFERRRAAALEELAGTLPPIPDLYRADVEELGFLLQQGDAAAPVMRAGGLSVSLGHLGRLIGEARQPKESRSAAEIGGAILASLETREKFFQQGQAEGLLDQPEVRAGLAAMRERELLALYRVQRLGERLDGEVEALKAYYEENRLRFAEPLRFELRQLEVATETPEEANVAMARLEASRTELGRSGLSFEALSEAVGGTIVDLGWRSLPELRAGSQRLAALLPGLEAGDYSPPFATRQGVAQLEVLARREPEAPPFEQVRPRVREAYLERHGQEVHRAWVADRLDSLDLRIVENLVP